MDDSAGLKTESVTATKTTKEDSIDGQNKYIIIHFVEILSIYISLQSKYVVIR